jgi:SNF2 family DNA or RNA helicase
VTTYEAAKRCYGVLHRIHWEVMVVDEAHKIKNWETVNFIMLNQYQATFKLLMTGTPLSNNLQELWCLLYFIMPGVF